MPATHCGCIQAAVSVTLLYAVGGRYRGAATSLTAPRPQLIDRVVDTLRDGGDVLLPCDSAGRVLELLLALDQHWMANRCVHYCCLSSPPAAHLTSELWQEHGAVPARVPQRVRPHTGAPLPPPHPVVAAASAHASPRPAQRHLAMSQIEWMSEQVAQQFSTQRANAFELKCARTASQHAVATCTHGSLAGMCAYARP